MSALNFVISPSQSHLLLGGRELRGGEFCGGKSHGGEFRGGESRGGEFRGGGCG